MRSLVRRIRPTQCCSQPPATWLWSSSKANVHSSLHVYSQSLGSTGITRFTATMDMLGLPEEAAQKLMHLSLTLPLARHSDGSPRFPGTQYHLPNSQCFRNTPGLCDTSIRTLWKASIQYFSNRSHPVFREMLLKWLQQR